MKQFIYGLIIFIFLALPPVRELAESIMAIHMHMQMPLIAAAGILMTPLLQNNFHVFLQSGMKAGFLVFYYLWLSPHFG